ncbi:MAG: hypothetical protein IJ538_03170 [Clostridia bacterium]|nr:hypothetical protein [Clostridia bacterium]
MENNTKIELAKAIVEKMLGEACVQSKNINNEKVLRILEMRKQVYHFNKKVIDELLEEYENSRGNAIG